MLGFYDISIIWKFLCYIRLYDLAWQLWLKYVYFYFFCIWLFRVFCYDTCISANSVVANGFLSKNLIDFFEKKMNKSLIKNGGILCLWALLWWGLFILSSETWLLTASVLDLAEMEQIQKSGRDIAYKHQDQLFEVFASQKLKDSESLHIQLLYNPDKLSLDLSSLNGTVLDQKHSTWELSLTLTQYQQIPLDQNLFQIAYSGEDKEILLGESYVLLSNGEKKALKVWNLSLFNLNNHNN